MNFVLYYFTFKELIRNSLFQEEYSTLVESPKATTLHNLVKLQFSVSHQVLLLHTAGKWVLPVMYLPITGRFVTK